MPAAVHAPCAPPLPPLLTPSRCQALLRLIVEVLLRARRQAAVRLQLYAAALQYLQFCRGSKLSRECAPPVLQALLQGWGTPPGAVVAMDQVRRRGGWVAGGVCVCLCMQPGKDGGGWGKSRSGNPLPTAVHTLYHLRTAVVVLRTV